MMPAGPPVHYCNDCDCYPCQCRCDNCGQPIDYCDCSFVEPPPEKKARPTRDETGLALARVWAERGTCARRRVGCVLFDVDGYQLSAGYNGPEAGAMHCTDVPCAGAALPSGTGLDACEAQHAELGALIRCSDPRAIHTCYCTTAPCVNCTKALLSTACQRIVFIEGYPQADAARSRWERAGREWLQLAV